MSTSRNQADPAAAGAGSDAPPISTDELYVSLGGVHIVEDVTFTLKRGELALLTGPNGAGKSTLLRALVGLLPSRGNIDLFGRPNGSLAVRQRFVFVPDEPALYEDLTLREHARFNALVYQVQDADDRALEWLARFGLEEKLDEFPGTHSRGMRQKLSLSLALGLERPLTLLDEPFNGLDIESQELLADALRARASSGGAVMLTGHQVELVDRLKPRLLRLDNGLLHG
ncbi:MAG: ABC transporter ATP-binding protein [Trueperaceae bacterium]